MIKDKRITVWIVCLMLLSVIISSIRTNAETFEDYQYEINDDGTVTITSYDRWDGSKDVIIPETINGMTVTDIGEGAFANNNLTSVILPEGLKSIGKQAFVLNDFEHIVIPDSVTYIGPSAFSSSQLKSVDLGKGVTHIGQAAFRRTNLESVIIPDNVTTIEERAFSWNESLTHVELGSGITSINKEVFLDSAITNITIPNSVTKIEDGAFWNGKLTNVNIPKSVESIGEKAFYNNELTSITIPDSVTSIGEWAFRFNKLVSVTFGSGLAEIGKEAFAVNELTSIIIPENVTSLGDGAFTYNDTIRLGSNDYLRTVEVRNKDISFGQDVFKNYKNNRSSLTIIGYDPSTAKDYAAQYGNTFINGGGEVTFSPNGSSEWNKSHSTEIQVRGYDETKALQYSWSAEEDTPLNHWTDIDLANSELINTPEETGNYYLHVQGTNLFGDTFNVRSQAFFLDNTKPTAPTITAPVSWQNSDVSVEIESGEDDHSGVSKTEYRIDGGLWETYSGAFSVSSIGETNIEAKTWDNAGNISDVTTFIVKIDKEQPEISVFPNGGDFAKSHTTTVDVKDSGGSGVAEIEYQWTKEEQFPTSGVFHPANSNDNLSTPSETGNHYLHIRGTDHAGNVTKFTSAVFKVDNTAPSQPMVVLPEINGKDGWYTTSPVELTIQLGRESEGESGVAETKYRLDDGIWQMVEDGKVTITKEGITEIEVITTDQVGNESDIAKVSIHLDSAVPVSPTIYLSEDNWTKDNVEVTMQKNGETPSGHDYIEWTKDFESDKWEKYDNPIEITESGETVIFVRSVNKAGTKSNIATAMIKVDKGEPSIELQLKTEDEQKYSGEWTNQDITLAIDFHNELSDIVTKEYSIDQGQNWQPYVAPVIFNEGEHHITIRAINEAGGIREKETVIKIDKTSPTEPLLSLNPNISDWINKTVIFTIQDGDDHLSGVSHSEYKIDNGDWFTYINQVDLSDSGEITVRTRTVDNAGNKSSEVVDTVQIDKTAPTIQFSNDGNTVGQREVSTKVTVDDAHSGVDENSLYYIWTDEYVAPKFDSDWEQFTNEDEIIFKNKRGTWYLHVYAKDLVGNETIQSTKAFQLSAPPSGGGGTLPSPSNDATLERLEVNFGEGSLIDFDPEQTEYHAETESATIELVAKPAHSGATTEINEEVFESKVTLSLKEGENTFRLVVIAEDGTTEEYTLTIHRLKEVPFPDIKEHWANDYIKIAYRNGWFKGYPDGNFRPDKQVSRMQAASLFVRILGLTDRTEVPFTDVRGIEDETIVELEKAFAHGIVNGYPDGTFKPYADVTRAQLALMIYRTYEKINGKPYQSKQNADFPDIAGYDEEMQQAIAMLVELGIAEGSNGKFLPNNKATRAHAAKMLVNFKKILDE